MPDTISTTIGEIALRHVGHSNMLALAARHVVYLHNGIEFVTWGPRRTVTDRKSTCLNSSH